MYSSEAFPPVKPETRIVYEHHNQSRFLLPIMGNQDFFHLHFGLRNCPKYNLKQLTYKP